MAKRRRVLIIDDEDGVRTSLRLILEDEGYAVETASSAVEGLGIAEARSFDVVLSDVRMPGRSGLDALPDLIRLQPAATVLMMSAYGEVEQSLEAVRKGAYDYLAKPFELEDLHNTVERAFERRRLIQQNRDYQQHLENMVEVRTEEVRHTRDIALLTLAKLAESRDFDTGLHLERMSEYSRVIAAGLGDGAYSGDIDDEFVEWVYKSSPLHDIGKVGIPDAILRKPGPLTPEEVAVMRTHTTIGGDTLRSVLEKYRGQTFLSMAMEIAYSHHERWDGAGYPQGLAGTDIPLAARIVTIADAYDAITSKRPYKEPFSHEEAVRRIVVDRESHFDPVLVDVFIDRQHEFEAIQQRLVDQQLTFERTEA